MRVLFTLLPGEGHLHPMVPLAKELIANGHDVAFACSPAFVPCVETFGFQAMAMGPAWLIKDDWLERWPELGDLNRQDAITFAMCRIFAHDIAEESYPDLIMIARRWLPDIIVRDTCEFGGWIAAEMLGLQHASIEVTLHSFTLAYADAIATSLTAVLNRAGHPIDNVIERLFSQLHLSFVPPSLEDPAVPMPARSHALRPMLLDPMPGEFAPDWLTTTVSRPTIYVTGGTVHDDPDFIDMLIRGVRDLDARVIVTVGRDHDPAQFQPQPADVHLAGYISQALLLPHCDVVVNHGGFSSVIGSLICGVPLVILPAGADHFVNGRRATALGVAIVLEGDEQTPTAIQAAVQTVLDDPRYRERAQAIQTEVANMPGPERGVQLLERAVAGWDPLARSLDDAFAYR